LVIRLQKKAGEIASTTAFRMGTPAEKEKRELAVKTSGGVIEIAVPGETTKGNPEVLAFEWN